MLIQVHHKIKNYLWSEAINIIPNVKKPAVECFFS